MGLEEKAEAAERKEALSYMSVTIASEIALICAVVLLFFVYLSLPLPYATGGALLSILFGSAIAWRNLAGAEAVFVLSVLAVEIVVLGYFPGMLLPFVAMDIAIIAWLASMWNVGQR